MESRSLYDDSPAPAPAVEKTSVIEDFLDIFYAPSQVYERRRDGSFGLALLLLVVVMVALYFATRAVMEPVFAEMADAQLAAMRKNGLPPEMVEAQRGVLEATLPLTPVIGALIAALGTGLLLWLVGKLFDSRQTLSQALMVSTYAQVPRFVLTTVVGALLVFALGADATRNPLAFPTSLARFLPPGSSGMLLQALNRVEIFTIWATILLGIGLSITGRVPKAQAFTAAGIVWLLATLLAVAGAAAGG